MSARTLLALPGVVLLVAGIALGTLQYQRGMRLRTEAMRLERLASEKARLVEDNSRLRSRAPSSEEMAELKRKRASIDSSRALLSRLEFQDRELKHAQGLPADPVWPKGAEVLESKNWKDVGQGNPRDALESVLWAAREGDIDRLAKLISFDSEVQTEAKAMYDSLPESGRSQYGSPEKVIATLIASHMPSDYAAMAENFERDVSPSAALVGIRLEDGTGDQKDLTFLLQRSGDDWHLDVPKNAVANYAGQLAKMNP